jgi:RNA polymerase sigma-70 factor (ECF subfamily)
VDELRSARARREAYVGTWLPEPLVTDTTAPVATADPADVAVSSDTLSMAFLLVLERLSPVERAAFLLHDVFGYEHAEVADVLGRSEAACRQLVSRARRHVRDEQPRFDVAAEERSRIGEQFFAAMREGDVDGLVAVLAEDAVVQGDSGGRSPSWPKVIVGRDKVARLMSSVSEQARMIGVQVRSAEVNGQPGAVVTDADGAVVNVLSLDIADGQVQAVRSVINPDKLAHLGRLADVPGLAAELRRLRHS